MKGTVSISFTSYLDKECKFIIIQKPIHIKHPLSTMSLYLSALSYEYVQKTFFYPDMSLFFYMYTHIIFPQKNEKKEDSDIIYHHHVHRKKTI